MIAFLDGIVAEKSPARAVLDVNGVGYELAISLNTYEQLPPIGDPARLTTITYIRDDTIQLFGFARREELELFRHLLVVPGIGPKLAMAVLSSMRPSEFRRAVRSGDAARLARTPGIGKKSAQRMIVELQGRFGDETTETTGQAGQVELIEQAMLALQSLGVKTDQAGRAVDKVIEKRGGKGISVEDLVREALSGV